MFVLPLETAGAVTHEKPGDQLGDEGPLSSGHKIDYNCDLQNRLYFT